MAFHHPILAQQLKTVVLLHLVLATSVFAEGSYFRSDFDNYAAEFDFRSYSQNDVCCTDFQPATLIFNLNFAHRLQSTSATLIFYLIFIHILGTMPATLIFNLIFIQIFRLLQLE